VTDPDTRSVLEDAPEPGWKDRVSGVKSAARALAATRAAIFREEVAAKGSLFAKSAAGLAIAGAFAVLALLLFTALLAAIFARLLGGPVAGLLATFLLYAVMAAAAGFLSWKGLSRVRPLDFPVTRQEIARDLAAVRPETPHDEEPASPEAAAAEAARVAPEEIESGQKRSVRLDLEERFRAGSE